jgi:type 1 glutamine amidotransferase
MPEGYAALGPEKLKDLVVFLTADEPPAAAPAPATNDATTKSDAKKDAPKAEEPNVAPPPRTRAEVEAVLGKLPARADGDAKARPLRVLLVAGPKDHGPGEHDYPAWQKRWEPLLAKAANVKVATAFGRPDAAQWAAADLVVFYCWGPQFWNETTYAHLDAFLARGGGLVLLHSAVIPEKDPQKLADRVGLAYPGMIKFRHGPLDLKSVNREGAGEKADDADGIMKGLTNTHFVDESYWPHVGDAAKVRVLATTPEEGSERPMAWTVRRGKGRVFATILGHYSWTFDDPLARVILLRGMAWAAGEPTSRFEALATDGVTLR